MIVEQTDLGVENESLVEEHVVWVQNTEWQKNTKGWVYIYITM